MHAVATGQFTTLQHGLRYGVSPRDEQKPLTGVGARVQRAFANYMQTFPFFAAAVLMAHVAGRHSWLTITGAQLYFWARLIYVPLYAAGIPVVRTLAFVIALIGVVLILIALT
ncbi:MAPEG family protein [Rhodopila sp.]|uniref:MAPEG family protein n=1 Tax=Rhodopila sp. TaxID=2480087 RepID=UPI003D12FBBF